MAITITKTLQTVLYTGLYFTTTVAYVSTTDIGVQCDGYQTTGHHTDMFLPIIQRRVVITDAAVMTSARLNYPFGMATLVGDVEAYLVVSDAFFTGGTVV
jgi:hypothetical protein